MKYFRWFILSIVCLGLSMGMTGCGIKKQVRYSSGPPNVAVSAKGLFQPSESLSTQITHSHNTRYVEVLHAEQ
ncbi:MAG: hypothetical protein O2999_08730 [Nitrospirae bacterium]|nr:hypothetical protein [Nitrospirota bacterium]MDA1304368.1 hypothetical protein [Nitrospirota bacterium]